MVNKNLIMSFFLSLTDKSNNILYIAKSLKNRSCNNKNFKHSIDEKRIASINEHPISESDRKFTWDGERRPDDFPTLSELEL